VGRVSLFHAFGRNYMGLVRVVEGASRQRMDERAESHQDEGNSALKTTEGKFLILSLALEVRCIKVDN
jgi:hypothetical protein